MRKEHSSWLYSRSKALFATFISFGLVILFGFSLSFYVNVLGQRFSGEVASVLLNITFAIPLCFESDKR
ncbi:hypothetical protein [Paenibacillus helianthi]|uniref:hypothetical protein n=1 Tax=Paenibacillus helianthi TaxID=1349432 RepID=UPI000AE6FA40|nr:hypothetical protein [Paenibacillus helianthi]